MPAATYINGFGGHVTFGSFILEVVEWSLKVDNGLIDVTNTGSSNWGQYIGGMNSGTVSVKAFWDTTAPPTGATANLLPGVSGTCVLNVGSSGKSVSCSAIIMSIDIANSPTSGVQYNFEMKVTTSPIFPT